jgi:hypothetical protein
MDKIAYWAKIDRLIEHPKLLPILLAWKSWGGGEACHQFIESSVRTERGLLAFLGATLQIPIEQAVSKQEKNPDWKKYLDNITYFIPTESMQALAIGLFEDDNFEQMREKEQLALLIFLDLTDASTTKLIPKTTV